MTLSAGGRGTAANLTSSTTFAFSPTSNCTAGAMIVLQVAADNAESLGVAHTVFTCTDSIGNTWTRRVSALYDPAGASAGVEGAVFTTLQDVGTILSSTVVTLTFNVATVAEAVIFTEIIGSVGVPTFVTSGVGSGAATTTPSVTTGTITNTNLVMGVCFAEGTDTFTGDADTTDGTWAAHQHRQTGTGGSSVSLSSQTKVVTATATQTYNPTLSASQDCIPAWIEISEVVSGSAQPPRSMHQFRQHAA